MNQTLSDLRAKLGAPNRFCIDAEPALRKRSVVTTVRWPCGCSASGMGLKALALAPCARHRPAPATARLRAVAGLLGR